MRLIDRLVGGSRSPQRANISDLLPYLNLNAPIPMTWPSGGREPIPTSFSGMATEAYGGNGVVFAVILARMSTFSEARFQWRQLNGGRPGKLFGSPELAILETPWPNATTGDLLARMEQDVSIGGNFFARRVGDRLERLRPDWVEIVGSDPAGAQDQLGRRGAVDLLGYAFSPGGKTNSQEAIFLLPDEVAHYAPIPDPLAAFRGMSWLTPVVREIEGDTAMIRHKNKFLENGATPNLILNFEQKLSAEAFDRLKEQIDRRYGGVDNAYRTMLLEGGVDATVVGANFQQMEFTGVQAAGENRIAAAGGVPGIVVGLKEGLEAATYSNYQQARRRFTDMTIRPLWRNAAKSLQTLVTVPANAHLWYDDRDIPALQEDAKDSAEIEFTKAKSMDLLVRAGFEPATVISAVNASDMTLLVHTGKIPTTLYQDGKDPTKAP